MGREARTANAALKAFLTTRTGDIGLMIGIIITFFVVGRATGVNSFNIVDGINHYCRRPRTWADHAHPLDSRRAICLLHRCDRQERVSSRSTRGCPTPWPAPPPFPRSSTPPRWWSPASSSLPACTRCSTRDSRSVSGRRELRWPLIGGITILVGAVLAFVQDDIKKVLAYSTISQLGYMVMALGCRCLDRRRCSTSSRTRSSRQNLFLGAGSVSHSGSHHSFDMKKDMGGLRKFMPQSRSGRS